MPGLVASFQVPSAGKQSLTELQAKVALSIQVWQVRNEDQAMQHAVRLNAAGGKVSGLVALSSCIACSCSHLAQAGTSRMLAGVSG